VNFTQSFFAVWF